jgi:hypothetical protein
MCISVGRVRCRNMILDTARASRNLSVFLWLIPIDDRIQLSLVPTGLVVDFYGQNESYVSGEGLTEGSVVQTAAQMALIALSSLGRPCSEWRILILGFSMNAKQS